MAQTQLLMLAMFSLVLLIPKLANCVDQARGANLLENTEILVKEIQSREATIKSSRVDRSTAAKWSTSACPPDQIRADGSCGAVVVVVGGARSTNKLPHWWPLALLTLVLLIVAESTEQII
ncbi:hypothetical protein O6H91_13G035700 [Diphasiastrum complanatum]|uniref:Uncharacterized protein n=1 Tax=Diphasiastrum complanatum TaxID=34168 RepID=A0ACC2BTT8_DIPCM|nr:hypothetical protein O6H91_13G035700 [Diphasiastrum complanatum]